MDYIFPTGLLGSLVLIAGAAWPEGRKKLAPVKSVKNWLFAVGALIMLTYAALGYFLTDSPVFFVFLEALVVIASVMMMLDFSDKIDLTVIAILAGIFIIWSLYLFQDFGTIFFILGLAGVSLGYALQTGSTRRFLALTLGSALIALFSYLEASWVFFWLNVFFALFSGYYLLKIKAHK
jgi:hypothetical protein